jgi:hypothetical protein
MVLPILYLPHLLQAKQKGARPVRRNKRFVEKSGSRLCCKLQLGKPRIEPARLA